MSPPLADLGQATQVTQTPDALLPPTPVWLPGGHAQTIWPAVRPPRHGHTPPRYRRERWTTPDGDFVDADWLVDEAPTRPDSIRPHDHERPLLVLFHGLEGSSQGNYALSFADWARRHGWAFVVPHFRGCSGELNNSPRAYHSGDFEEIGWMLAQARTRHHARHRGPVVAVGISLGGNALLRWAEEAGAQASGSVSAVAAVCSPVDLAAGGHAIGEGFNRWVYTPWFLRTMKPKALAKLAQFPGLFDGQALHAARTLYEFDNLFTAPLHGFRDTPDYWARASAKPHLAQVQVPALLLNPLNDPFVPAHSLPRLHQVGRHVTLWQPRHGGHVGFVSGRFPGHVMSLPAAVMGWLRARL